MPRPSSFCHRQARASNLNGMPSGCDLVSEYGSQPRSDGQQRMRLPEQPGCCWHSQRSAPRADPMGNDSGRGSLRLDRPKGCSAQAGNQGGDLRMIVTTTPSIEGHRITEYLGLVTGEVILGANVVRDFFASVRDVVGGRSGSYEKVLRHARDAAVEGMVDEARAKGADAVLAVDLDYEVIGKEGSMLMVSASGTAVKLG